MHHVYSRCHGHRQYLECNFTGTRSQCLTYLRHLRKAGRPTHFYFVSTLDHHAATKRYIDN